MGSWMGWSNRLIEVGFSKFYESWSDYLPGYMYVLYLLGGLWKVLPHAIPAEVFYKLPSIITDCLAVLLIYGVVKKLKDERSALIASFIYGISPAVWGNSALWGQSDSFATIPIVLALVIISNVKRLWGYLASGLFLGIASTIKPSGAFVLPLFLLFLILREKKEKSDLTTILVKVLLFSLAYLLIFVLAFVPFNETGDVFSFIITRFQLTMNQYKYTSLNAFNFWSIGGGGWKDDSSKFLALSLQQWGIAMFSGFYFLVFVNMIKKFLRKHEVMEYDLVLSSAAVFLSGFLFLTRAHERHIFPVFALMAMAAGIKPRLWVSFIVLSIISALNLRYAYVWLSKGFEQIFSYNMVSGFSIFSIAVLFWMLVDLFKGKVEMVSKMTPKTAKAEETQMSEVKFYEKPEKEFKGWKKYFAFILVFGVLTRFIYLNNPPAHMFDEVYHAFTAQEIVRGNKAAWEWWNSPPAGFAYEWSHPPFAKLAMAVPLKVFGVEHAWAWRSAVAVFGVGVIIMIYLVTQLLFGKRAGLLAMFLTTIDGLVLTQSRIGMNDIFFVFFMLLACYTFLRWMVKEKGRGREMLLLATGVSLGLSLSSKWTAMYGIGILGAWFLVILLLKAKDKTLAWVEAQFKGLVVFLVLPVVMYLFVYLPFFTSGHNFSQFVELQKQMWWYHTGLKATHPFQSQFWQWPLDLRPVWFWVDYKDTTTANIYNLGNPAIFWVGDIAIVLGLLSLLIWLFRSKKFKLIRKLPAKFLESSKLDFFADINSREVFGLLFAFSGFLGFWLPWAHSPRIMFFYHFLPSLFFMIMILSWVLTRLRDRRIFLAYLVLACVLFVYFSPIWYGFPVPKNLVDQFFWLKLWR